MGLFDFLKKKRTTEDEPIADKPIPSTLPTDAGKSINDLYAQKNTQPADNKPIAPPPIADEPAPEGLYRFIFKYGEYVVRYINMMLHDNQSPIAAYEKPDGELIGYLFIAEDFSYNLSVEQVIEKMELEFEKRMAAGSIISWTIYYHSEFNNDNNHKVADEHSKTRAISIKYKSNSDLNGYLAMPYTFSGDDVAFRGFSSLSKPQNDKLLAIELQPEKDYFQEKITIEPPHLYTNDAGIKIKTVNNGTLGTMWSGIFGFDRLRRSNQILLEYMALILSRKPSKTTADVTIHEVNYDDVIFRGVATIDEERKTAYPTVKPINYFDVENKQIAEWENSDNLEAVISGGGRNIFGISYFATDYAENKALYHTNPKLNMAFSGILFVLDQGNDEQQQLPDGTLFAEGFASYMPHESMGQFGCYDFMGILEDFREVSLLENNLISGYIVKVRLINNEEINDYFSIPMFINKDHMRFSTLKKGMKINGMFQLLGEIKK